VELTARFLERRVLPSVTAAGVALLVVVSGPLLVLTAGQWPEPRLGLTVALSTAILFCGHVLRAEKMVLLLGPLQPECRLPVYRCLAIGFLFNAILPFRAGELIRAHLLGRDLGISRAAALMTIAFERVVDAVFLGSALVAFVVFEHRSPRLLYPAASLLGLGVVVSGLLAALLLESRSALRLINVATGLLNDRLRDRLRFSAWSAMRFLRIVLRSRQPLAYLALSVLMWVTYIEAIATLARALLGALASSPGVVAALAFVGAAKPLGVASFEGYFHALDALTAGWVPSAAPRARFAAVSWFVLIVPTALVGLGFLLTRRAPRPAAAARANTPASIAKLMRNEQMSREFGAFLADYFGGSSLVHVLNDMEARGQCRNLRIFTGGSHAITALVDVDGALRVRKLALMQHAGKLQAQCEWLTRYQQAGHVCPVLGSFSGAGVQVLDLEYRSDLEPFYRYIHRVPTAASAGILDALLAGLAVSVYAHPRRVFRPEALEHYIEVKVLQKIADAAEMCEALRALTQHRQLIVNGHACLNIPLLIERIRGNPRILEELGDFEESDIHGDLTVDNILVTDDRYLVLDPNNENEISDRVVDLAKLFQSLRSGYEFLRGLTTVDIDGHVVRFVEERSHQYQALCALLDARAAAELPPHRYRALLFHEAVHYCRMLTYRAALAPHTVGAFYGVAVRLLNEFAAQYPPAEWASAA
jgi:hypothetical protein